MQWLCLTRYVEYIKFTSSNLFKSTLSILAFGRTGLRNEYPDPELLASSCQRNAPPGATKRVGTGVVA